MTARFRPARSRRTSPRLIVTTLCALLLAVAASGGFVASGGRALAAGPTASVIAQGVSALPAGAVVWRVVTDRAQVPSEAQFEERALGFAIATGDPILLTDETTGTQMRLGSGEAAFVPEGIRQRRESLGAAPASYLRIGLAPAADAEFTAGGNLVYASDAFAPPPGRRDLDLIRLVLGADQSANINAAGVPTLLIVRSGEVEVTVPDVGSVVLGSGDVVALPGKLTIAASGDADVLVGLIGPEVRPTASSATTRPATTKTGEVWAVVRGCPVGQPASDAGHTEFDTTCREPLAGTVVHLQSIDDGTLDLAEPTVVDIAAPGQSLVVWRGVPAGDYALFPDQPAGYQGLAAFCRTAGDTGPPRPVQNTGFRLDPGAERSCFFFFRPAEGTSPESAATGTLYLQIFACPVGITEADLPDAQDACDIDYGIMELFLGGDAFDGALTLADATPTQNAIGWTDLPLGNYYLAFRAGEAVVFSATDADALGSPVSNTATSYPVTLTARNPEVLFQVYHLEYPPLLDSGSLTIQVWNCPPEMIPQAYDPAACAPAEPGVGQPLVTSPDGAVYVFDVQGDGGLYVINVLPYGVYFVGMVDSFFWTIEGLPGDSFEGSFPPIEIGPDNPDLFLTIYNFPHLNE